MTRVDDVALRRLRSVLKGMWGTVPYYSSLALRLPIAIDKSRDSLATDGESLFFSPDWVNDNTADTIRSALAGCIAGCVLKHHTRRGERDYARWQAAHREVVKPILKADGFTVDGDGLDMSIEAAYDQMTPPEDDDPSPSPDSQDGESQGEGESQGQDDQSQEPDEQDGQGEGQGDQGGQQDGDNASQEGQQPEGGQGSQGGQDGAGEQKKPASSDPDGGGEMMDAPRDPGDTDGEHEAKLKSKEQDWDNASHVAGQHAKSEGKDPGFLSGVLTEAHSAKVDYLDLLRRFMTGSVRADANWSRPNRRFISQGLYLPDLHSPAMDRVVFAMDVSGSVNDRELNQVWGEIRGAVDELMPASVTLIQADERVTVHEELEPLDMPEEIEVKGRGGTAFSPTFQAIDDGPRPACVIYYTDLCCSDYGPEPDYPVLWLVTGTYPFRQDPPFGEVIEIEGGAA